MVSKGKGWHNEYLRHSEARLYGRASGKTYLKDGVKLKQPKGTVKGKTYSINGKKSTFLLLGNKKNSKMRNIKFPKESFTHLIKKQRSEAYEELENEKRSKEIEQEYNAITKPEYRTYKYTTEEEQAEFDKERAEHPSFSTKQISQIIEDHEPEEKETRKDSYDKALYFKKELLKEVRKKSPDKEAVAYYKKEFLKAKRKVGKTYFVPVVKK